MRKISKQDLNPQSLREKKKKDDFDHLKTEDFFLIKDSKNDAKKYKWQDIQARTLEWVAISFSSAV